MWGNSPSGQKGQSSTVAVTLTVGVVVLLVALVGAFVLTEGTPEEEPLFAGIELNPTAEAVTITHDRGDTVDLSGLTLTAAGDVEGEFTLDEFGDGQFTAGDRIVIPVDEFDGVEEEGWLLGEFRFDLTHQPTNSLLLDERKSIAIERVTANVDSEDDDVDILGTDGPPTTDINLSVTASTDGPTTGDITHMLDKDENIDVSENVTDLSFSENGDVFSMSVEHSATIEVEFRGESDVVEIVLTDDGDEGDDPEPPGDELDVSTGAATAVGETGATLNGSLADVDGDEADVWFEYGPVGAGFPEMADAGTAGVGGFSAEIVGLDPGTSYEFRAVASTADENDEGAVETFKTDGGDDGDEGDGIQDWNDLADIDSEGESFLANDLDETTDGYGEQVDTENGWEPIGEDGDPFTGTLDGNGNTISDLVINREDEEYVGLFADLAGEVTDLTVEEAEIAADNRTGVIAGRLDNGSVEDVSVSGEVSADGLFAGGIVGQNGGTGNDPGTITDSDADVDVNADDVFFGVGGAAGWSEGDIIGVRAEGDVVGGDRAVGGLVGLFNDAGDGEIRESSAHGDVEGDDEVGGLVGDNEHVINDSYATGDVNGESKVGGAIGRNAVETTRLFATGEVTGNNDVGGLAGINTVADTVDGPGGIGELNNSYWDTDATGQEDAAGSNESDIENVEGLSTDAMQDDAAADNMDAFDFEDTWQTVDDDYPDLR